MKRKINQLLYFAICATAIMLLSGRVMAQKGAPPLNPILQGYAEGGSTANFIHFRQGTAINPETIFTDLKEAFELSEDDQMKLSKTESDDLGFKHYRYQQYYKNLKVMYGEFIVHQNKDGFVRTANGRLITGLKLNAASSLAESQGLDAALHFMNAKKYLWQNEAMQQELRRSTRNADATYYPKGELVYAPGNYEATYHAADYRLAWRFSIYTDDKDVVAKAVYVDALTGKVILHTDIAMNCAGGTGTSAFNGTVSTFNTELTGGTYRSHDNCQATDIYVYNCNGGGASNTFYTDADNNWNLTAQQSSVQAQYGAERTYNYYINQHNRASWDGASGDLIAYNNAFAGSNNACWGCTGNQAIFYAGNTSAATDDWNTDDIMGHEFTHGVTQASAGLAYNKESGGLNESYSDIFGEMVESWAEGNCDYLVGADRGAIRSFINPNTYGQPEAYLGLHWYNTVGCTPSSGNDNCGVHTNSGVQNHWFYLLSEGGSGTNEFGKSYNVTGITRFKARLIAYRALTVYETSTTDYLGARAATLLAAFDLYGGCSQEIQAVGDAWHAVNVESLSASYQNDICGVVASGDFKQAISVITGANGCANSIATGANVTYYAARDQVVLYQGFIAPTGSRFIAYLEPCSSTLLRSTGDNNDAHLILSDAEKGIHPPIVALKQPVIELLTEQNQTVSVSPNPFRSSFNLTINAKQDGKAQVVVYNSLGMKVMEKAGINVSKGSNQTTFDGSKLAPGVYMVEIHFGEEKTVKKMVKI